MNKYKLKKSDVVIRIVTTRKEAKKLWLKYCEPKVVWDLWRIREIFLDVFKPKIHFVEALRNGESVGMLPLVFNQHKKKYEWLGWWSETNRVFVEDPEILKMMLRKVKGKIVLASLDSTEAKKFGKGIKKDSDQFILNLRKLNWSWENFLAKMKKKKRQNLRRDIRAIDSMQPKFRYNKIDDLKHFVRLNKMQMRRKVKLYDDMKLSIFETDKNEIKVFRKLFKQAGKDYKVRILTVIIDDKVVGVDFCVIYKNRYTAMLGGLNIKAVSGIGVYMNYLDIKDAIDHQCDYADFMMDDCHWKKDWFKQGRKRYSFERESFRKQKMIGQEILTRPKASRKFVPTPPFQPQASL
jgi:hypothetical protein